MSLIGKIAGAAISVLTGGFVDTVKDLATAYLSKEISEAEFRSRVEISAHQMTAAMVESVQATVRSSPVIQRAYALTVYSLIVVLVWYWLGAPAFLVATGVAWPDPPISLGWAHGLLGGLLVGWPVVLPK